MDRSFNSFFETLSLLCSHHGVSAISAFKKFVVGKKPPARRAVADRACRCIMILSAEESKVLGISTPAYVVCTETGVPPIVFIGTYRDGAGNTQKYAGVSTSESLFERSGNDTSYPFSPDDASPKSGGAAELMAAARASGEEGKQDQRRRRQW
jgi:hypothetical protein